MKVTNNSKNAMVFGGTTIAPGATETVEDWDSMKDSFAVKRFIEAEVISIGAAEKPAKAPKTKDEFLAALKELGVEADASKTVAELSKLLDEKKAATA